LKAQLFMTALMIHCTNKITTITQEIHTVTNSNP